MKNWLCILILISFIRLQFVCCCGSIEHGSSDRQAVASELTALECCPPKVSSPCTCRHHSNESNSPTPAKTHNAAQPAIGLLGDGLSWIASTEGCECELCTGGHGHLPHLFAAQHLRVSSQPELRLDTHIVKHLLPSAKIVDVECLDSRKIVVTRFAAIMHVDIISQLGRLLI